MKAVIEKLCTADEFSFEVKEELRIGTMRVDFNDGCLANKWVTSGLIKIFLGKFHMKAMIEVQKVVNDIEYRLLDTFDKVVKVCGAEGYDYETDRFISYGNCNYWIRLIPVMGEYNYYIKIYVKEELM